MKINKINDIFWNILAGLAIAGLVFLICYGMCTIKKNIMIHRIDERLKYHELIKENEK